MVVHFPFYQVAVAKEAYEQKAKGWGRLARRKMAKLLNFLFACIDNLLLIKMREERRWNFKDGEEMELQGQLFQ